MTLGTRIGSARKRAGLKRQELAEAVGRSVHTVRKWENDQHEPSLAMLQRIADLTGVSVSYLMGESSEGDLTEIARARATLAAIRRREQLATPPAGAEQPPHHPGVAALAASELYRREYHVSDEELQMLRTCLIRRADGGYVVITTIRAAVTLLEALRQME